MNPESRRWVRTSAALVNKAIPVYTKNERGKFSDDVKSVLELVTTPVSKGQA